MQTENKPFFYVSTQSKTQTLSSRALTEGQRSPEIFTVNAPLKGKLKRKETFKQIVMQNINQ